MNSYIQIHSSIFGRFSVLCSKYQCSIADDGSIFRNCVIGMERGADRGTRIGMIPSTPDMDSLLPIIYIILLCIVHHSLLLCRRVRKSISISSHRYFSFYDLNKVNEFVYDTVTDSFALKMKGKICR